jgi:hypothetical protein
MTVRDQVRQIIKNRGVREACEATGLPRESVLRLAADAPVRKGTELVAETNLRRKAEGNGGHAA